MASRYLPRVYVFAHRLVQGGKVPIDEHTAHHLMNVLRMDPGQEMRVFNPVDGEFVAQLQHAGHRAVKTAVAVPISQIRPGLPAAQTTGPTFGHGPLLMAPLLHRKEAVHYMIQKAVECGAGAIMVLHAGRSQGDPAHVRAARTGAGKGSSAQEDERPGLALELDSLQQRIQQTYVDARRACGFGLHDKTRLSKHIRRMWAWAIDASEQCGRLDVPPILTPGITVPEALKLWTMRGSPDQPLVTPQPRLLMFCDEGAAEQPKTGTLHDNLKIWATEWDMRESGGRKSTTGAQATPSPPLVGLMIGPEGGWSPEESALMKEASHSHYKKVNRVSLGPRTLRAETAAVAALTQANVIMESARHAHVFDPASVDPVTRAHLERRDCDEGF